MPLITSTSRLDRSKSYSCLTICRQYLVHCWFIVLGFKRSAAITDSLCSSNSLSDIFSSISSTLAINSSMCSSRSLG
ncbi:unnamed protein product [Rodentolepis nana]|uniref:Secreted protein n=1 Tax=Rodentolepis nana TaxID=102285 RepID=A0A0R3TQJ7_RODNA|nr:unnamed protein product [Rodentolepis nana]